MANYMPSLAVVLTYWILALYANGAQANSRVTHLRAALKQQPQTLNTFEVIHPPSGVVAQAPASPEVANAFAKMDLNKDGKVDVTEFANAQKNGMLAHPGLLAPGPAPGPAPAPGSAPAPASLKAEDLPPHLRPPALPERIPEPPDPPRPPPAEPAPPQLPPREGQLVGPPPSEDAVEAAGNLTGLMVGVPGLDLDGRDPLQAPNAPPQIPEPLLPQQLPRIFGAFPPPQKLPPAIMTPAPVAFGVDVARTLPQARKSPLAVPPTPDFSFLIENNHLIPR
jgi:hypothetical protein